MKYRLTNRAMLMIWRSMNSFSLSANLHSWWYVIRSLLKTPFFILQLPVLKINYLKMKQYSYNYQRQTWYSCVHLIISICRRKKRTNRDENVYRTADVHFVIINNWPQLLYHHSQPLCAFSVISKYQLVIITSSMFNLQIKHSWKRSLFNQFKFSFLDD